MRTHLDILFSHFSLMTLEGEVACLRLLVLFSRVDSRKTFTRAQIHPNRHRYLSKVKGEAKTAGGNQLLQPIMFYHIHRETIQLLLKWLSDLLSTREILRLKSNLIHPPTRRTDEHRPTWQMGRTLFLRGLPVEPLTIRMIPQGTRISTGDPEDSFQGTTAHRPTLLPMMNIRIMILRTKMHLSLLNYTLTRWLVWRLSLRPLRRQLPKTFLLVECPNLAANLILLHSETAL
jgi:hypothetical protein